MKVSDKSLLNRKREVLEYMNGKFTLRDAYNQIQNKTCTLSSSLRDYVLSHFWSDGTFIEESDDEFKLKHYLK